MLTPPQYLRESLIVGRLLGITLMPLVLPTFVLSLGAAVLHRDRSRLWGSGVTTLFDRIGVAELLGHCLADRLVGIPDIREDSRFLLHLHFRSY